MRRQKIAPVQVSVQPALLRWARERVSLDQAELAQRVGLKQERVTEWETTGQLTLARLERLASKTYTPIGYLFLPAPPDESLPIPDFRTVGGDGIGRASPNLLDTIYQCQQRQDWFREYLVEQGVEPLPFVGSANLRDSPEEVAQSIRTALDLPAQPGAGFPNWDEALRGLVATLEGASILVMRNGVVGNNTHRKLDIQEFRGFALSDVYAPLVFVNGSDSAAAQRFTLAHELAHVWLGQSGVSDVQLQSDQEAEKFSNRAAAELLVPMRVFREFWRSGEDPAAEAMRLSRAFKVSRPVILIRARDAGFLSTSRFEALYASERSSTSTGETTSGGDFYRTQGSRLGKRFARAVVTSALEGRTTYTEAFQLLGLKKIETFNQLARTLGVSE